ncbi:MAG: monovalent cation/H(+) antiporter subunit G [Actinomycetota bacterium]|nr:monovalent cation/H(+) antiporter subunit G [Actinomycetota bacterium]
MFEIVLNSITIILCCIGIFFFVVGTVGLLRLPDAFSRLHATTKCDTLGAGSILVGLAVYERGNFDSAKLLILAFLVLVTSSTTGHALARAAFKAGLKPWRKEQPSFPEEGSEGAVEA